MAEDLAKALSPSMRLSFLTGLAKGINEQKKSVQKQQQDALDFLFKVNQEQHKQAMAERTTATLEQAQETASKKLDFETGIQFEQKKANDLQTALNKATENEIAIFRIHAENARNAIDNETKINERILTNQSAEKIARMAQASEDARVYSKAAMDQILAAQEHGYTMTEEELKGKIQKDIAGITGDYGIKRESIAQSGAMARTQAGIAADINLVGLREASAEQLEKYKAELKAQSTDIDDILGKQVVNTDLREYYAGLKAYNARVLKAKPDELKDENFINGLQDDFNQLSNQRDTLDQMFEGRLPIRPPIQFSIGTEKKGLFGIFGTRPKGVLGSTGVEPLKTSINLADVNNLDNVVTDALKLGYKLDEVFSSSAVTGKFKPEVIAEVKKKRGVKR